MMPLNSNKRKGRLNPGSSKLGKSKFYPEKNMSCDGIYGNSRLMYTAASLVGCVVQIQVQNGAVFEGVLRTFSHQLDLVLETAHRVTGSPVSPKGVSPSVGNLISSYPFEGGLFDRLIFKLSDVILMVARHVDTEYALKDNFTDRTISKFNGQVRERELEPWEDGSDSELGCSIEDEEEGTNGWDANDMFRTNAEKYGVTSTYDNTLLDYTVPLTKKDTAEFKQQEARAQRIAQEIEETCNPSSTRALQAENGDNEEEKYSAVIRSEEMSRYVLPQKRRNSSGHRRLPSANSCSVPSTLPYSSSLPVLDEPLPVSPPLSSSVTNVPKTAAAPKSPSGDVPVESECADEPPPPKTTYCSTLPPRIERRRESEKKFAKHRGRTDEIEEFKKFSTNFKLSEEKEDPPEEEEMSSKMERTQLEDEEDLVKFSTLNPNAKEFVFNPNAKAFTPRSMPPLVAPPPMQDPPPPQQVAMPGQLFAAHPQYHVMQAPVSLAFHHHHHTNTVPPPRFRKASGQQQQQLLSSSGVVPSQLVQYSTSSSHQGAAMLHHHASATQQVGYPQMNFVVGPRVVSPQPVGVIPTSVSYCDTSHLPTHHLIMSAHTAASTLQQQQGLNHPPQCHTPVTLHPSPSPVHQVPTQMYTTTTGGQQGHPSVGGHTVHYPGGPPQPVVLMQQGQLHPMHLHQSHILPQMTLIPTSAANTNTPPFMQHQ